MAPDKPFKHVTDSTKLHVIDSMFIVAPAQTTLPEQSSPVLLNHTANSAVAENQALDGLIIMMYTLPYQTAVYEAV